MANSPEHGLFQLIDLDLLNPNMPATAADPGLMQSGIIISAAQHNRDINALLATFARTTADYQLEFQQMAGGRSQPVDEHGRAIPVKPLAPYTVGLPIIGSGTAMGANYITRQQMTVRDLARTMATMFRGDYQWVLDQILARLLDNASYTFRDPTGKGNLTIQGPANGDAVVYYKTGLNGTETDTHYFAQDEAIADANNPYPTIVADLREHPDNGREVVVFISTSLKAGTTGLAEFHAADLDPDIRLGTDDTRLTGRLGIALPVGAEVLGKTESGAWIVEWPALPSGYGIAITIGGEKPLARRVFVQEQLQGFRSVGERNDFPYFEEQWQRWEGYGAWNRAGAAVLYAGTSDSYAIPTGYDAPLG